MKAARNFWRRLAYRVRAVRLAVLDQVLDGRVDDIEGRFLSWMVGLMVGSMVGLMVGGLTAGVVGVPVAFALGAGCLALAVKPLVEPLWRLERRVEAQSARLALAYVRTGRGREGGWHLPDVQSSLDAVWKASAQLDRPHRRLIRAEAQRLAQSVDQVLEVGLAGEAVTGRYAWHTGMRLSVEAGPAGNDLVAIVKTLNAQLRELEQVAALQAVGCGTGERELARAQERTAAQAKLAALRELLEAEEPHETFTGIALPRARAVHQARRGL